VLFRSVAGGIFLVGIVLGVVHMVAERRRSPIAHLSKPMKLASIIPAVVGCALFVSWIPQPHGVDTNAPEIVWIQSETEGRAKATAQNKPVLVDFGATWCTACKELEHNTFPNPGVRTEAQRFIAIHVDATDDDAPDTKRLQEKYKVIGLPTVIMLDNAGNEVARFNEYVPPEKFLAAMKKVPSSSAAVGMK
jgi:thiol:disulfide interchange protein DsbD